MSSSFGAVPAPADAQVSRGYGSQPVAGTAPAQQLQHEVVTDGPGLNRSASTASVSAAGGLSRNGTLKKRGSVRRTGSLHRSLSKRSLQAGSLRGLGDFDGEGSAYNNIFNTPIPTSGSPTEVLANRFQAWRQLLKSLIAYFREIQNSYDARAKAIHKVQNTLTNIAHPSVFMSDRGLGDASRILDDFHKRSIAEANKSRDIEDDVIGALTGLRSDLGQKIKEIKSLNGDFKNSVDKEKDATRRELEKLHEALVHADQQDGTAIGKNDPYVVRLGVDRAIEKQIDEENYLHRAYLNLESSGRELESIVVGEIQKAYNALAGILKREGDDAYSVVESLRVGPIAMPKDQEWYEFVTNDPHFVDPSITPRRIDDIEYPGKNHPAAGEIRSGMLERKSKYLKSYTPGWYVLSSTHLHEFKSADKIYSQPPVMSLYLPDQKLGSHSELGSSSHKFMLKGKQSGGVHKGHNWVFRAETHETMLAWFEAIKNLTEKSPEERDAYVLQQTRANSAMDDRHTISSDGFEEDEADQVPYTDVNNFVDMNPQQQRVQRPQPGGRFPSDVHLHQTGLVNDSDSDDVPVTSSVVAPAAVAVPTVSSAVTPSQPNTNQLVSAGVVPGTTPFEPRGDSIAAQINAQAVPAAAASAASAPVASQPPPVVFAPVATESAATQPVATQPAANGSASSGAAAAQTSKLGGLESEGAHETGRLFPSVVRHDTSLSVSALHVPGEFPKRP